MGGGIGLAGIGQGVPGRGNRRNGHMGLPGGGGLCGGNRRGGVGLAAAEHSLPHQQHRRQGQRRCAQNAQQPRMAALPGA